MHWIIQRNGIAKAIEVRDLTPDELNSLNSDDSYQSDELVAIFTDPGIPSIAAIVRTHEESPFIVFPKAFVPFIRLTLNTIVNMTLKLNAIVGNTSGNFKLQAKGNALTDWTDLQTDTGQPVNGSFSLPDLTIDPTVLIPGSVYLLRVIDTTTGLTSNVIRQIIPAPFSMVMGSGNFALNALNIPCMDLSGTNFTNGSGTYSITMLCNDVHYSETISIVGPANGLWGTNGLIQIPSFLYGQNITLTLSDPAAPATNYSVTLLFPECSVVNVNIPVANTPISITMDGSGSINWGDGSSVDTYSHGSTHTADTHTFGATSSYNICLYNISSMTTFQVGGSPQGYATAINQLPDTILNIDIHGNQFTDSGIPDINNPSSGIQLLNIEGNKFSSAAIDQIINSFQTIGLGSGAVLKLAGQTPPAPPTPASALCLAALLAAGVTVVHD